MPGRSTTRNRCARCGMRDVLCLCPLIPEITLRTRVTVLMHSREVRKTTNTGKLATLALSNSELRIRGRLDPTAEPAAHPPAQNGDLVSGSYRTLLLLPTLDAVELTREFVESLNQPVHLVVADGNWNQARKVATREAALRRVARVKLPVGRPAAYFLRQTPHAENLSTFEAVSRALGIIEGPAIERRLDALFEVLIERSLWGRGKLPLHECRTGIPQAAIEAFYRAGVAGSRRVLP